MPGLCLPPSFPAMFPCLAAQEVSEPQGGCYVPLLHKKWGLASKTFNAPSNTVSPRPPLPSPRSSPYIKTSMDDLARGNQDFAHSGGLQDPLPAALGHCPIKSSSGSPSCSRHHSAQLGVQQRPGHQTAPGRVMAGSGSIVPGCQYNSAHLIGFRCLTAKEILEIESGVQDFKPLGFLGARR